MTSMIPAPRLLLAATAIVAGATLLAACDPGAPPATGGATSGGTNGGASTAPADGMTGDGEPDGPQTAPPVVKLPKYWFKTKEEFDQWVGQRWTEIDLLQFLPQAPRGLDEGTRYVVFYGSTCDHCEEMFKKDLVPDPTLAARVTAVEVPTSDPPSWQRPETACELLTLPEGPDWIITTPLTLRIENGVVQCATEGDHKVCMGLE